ncbi:MAG: YdjY domain-containing protein [Planctomycetota bacterium]
MRVAPLLVLHALLLHGCASTPSTEAGSEPENASVGVAPQGDPTVAEDHPTRETADRSETPVTESTAPAPKEPRIVELPGMRVLVDESTVEVEAWTCLDDGWLEQVACSPGTREHESLLVVNVRPSELHAALLMAGLSAGRPGRWSYDEEGYHLTPPEGDVVDILVRYVDRSGEEVTDPVSRWIRDERRERPFPDRPWVFGGSVFAKNPEGMGEGEHYVADMTGSVVGLVTFGDEVVGFSEVMADEESVQEPEWMVDRDQVPAMGTRVTLILKRGRGSFQPQQRSD